MRARLPALVEDGYEAGGFAAFVLFEAVAGEADSHDAVGKLVRVAFAV